MTAPVCAVEEQQQKKGRLQQTTPLFLHRLLYQTLWVHRPLLEAKANLHPYPAHHTNDARALYWQQLAILHKR
jgi:hypothetical protein